MGHQLQKLKSKHREIARLAARGRTPTEIAKSPSVDMTPEGVRNVMSSRIFLELYAELTVEADQACLEFGERMKIGKEMAVDRIIETLKPDAKVSKALQSKNAFELLNTTEKGHKMPSTLVAAQINPTPEEVMSPKVLALLGDQVNPKEEEETEVIDVEEEKEVEFLKVEGGD